MTEPDPYLWLEALDETKADAWVRERSAEAVAALTADPGFADRLASLREVLDSERRIPVPGLRGEYLYNFWRDAEHPRGLWRRTTLAEYRTSEPSWQVLIDVDALAAEEDENWVWQDVSVLRPSYRRALVSLSRGGSDAAVVREFDLDRQAFVPDGFVLPEAKSRVGWIDEDEIYVGTDFGPGSLTSSGYPRTVRRWRRGTSLADAPVLYEGAVDDVVVVAYRDPTPGYERDFVVRRLDFYRSETYLCGQSGELVRLEVPEQADVDCHRDWLLISLRTEWTVDGVTYPSGSLLVARMADFLAGNRTLTVLFEPDAHTSLQSYARTRDHLVIATLVDVKSRLAVFAADADGWHRISEDSPLGHTDVVANDPDHSNDYLLLSSGFTEPATLRRRRAGTDEVELLKQDQAYFDASGLAVEQYFATSADGTQVPYFVVGRGNGGPTLLGGYGGFLQARVPSYSGLLGRGWLARGGTYALANIRGGGEYGPQWHQAALRENRPRAYEDFAAVAMDLVNRGITTAPRLGISGGSNGGLLMGVMLTQYPQLFGAIVVQVPLLDMRRYHKLHAGASWIAEYGDPDDPSDWEFLRRYSPYHNVQSGLSYPPSLFATSTRDDRVHPGHARKMVARLLDAGHEVTYYENTEGGHGAAADNAQLAFLWAITYEFLWRVLGPS
jgi:prolyl oligopeptidase